MNLIDGTKASPATGLSPMVPEAKALDASLAQLHRLGPHVHGAAARLSCWQGRVHGWDVLRMAVDRLGFASRRRWRHDVHLGKPVVSSSPPQRTWCGPASVVDGEIGDGASRHAPCSWGSALAGLAWESGLAWRAMSCVMGGDGSWPVRVLRVHKAPFDPLGLLSGSTLRLTPSSSSWS